LRQARPGALAALGPGGIHRAGAPFGSAPQHRRGQSAHRWAQAIARPRDRECRHLGAGIGGTGLGEGLPRRFLPGGTCSRVRGMARVDLAEWEARLPVTEAVPRVAEALATSGAAVLEAPPGAGKTTLVPLKLLDAPWLSRRRIVMLEPRRLAARVAARRMATMLGERVGETVGYRTRLDTKIGPGTRLEVVTEGILVRALQNDAALEGVGLVIFDEFHERSLDADLGLALALEARRVLRPDLRLLVMSATLNGAEVARLLGDAPVIAGSGRMFPVETRHLARPPPERIGDGVVLAIRRAL